MLKKEISYGIIPLRQCKGKWQTLLVRHGKGHWGFPKGHPEEGEEPNQTAARELEEETGLKVAIFLDIPQQKEHYVFRHGSDLIDKTVIYFAAEVKGKVAIQQAEISDYKWLHLQDARKFVTFSEAKRLCTTMIEYLEPPANN